MLSPYLFNLYAVYIIWNAGLDEAQAGIKIAGRNISNIRYADDTTLMAESEERKSHLMKVKVESENVGLKLNIQKTKITASGSITSWQIDGETVRNFILLGSKITADGDCSHEIKRQLLLERKVMTNLDSILNSRNITLPTKVHLFKAIIFPVVIYGWDSWTIKKTESRRIDAFELWCWRWLVRVPWSARRSNQSILREISPEYSLEGLVLKLKLQYFGNLMWRTDSLEKALMLGNIKSWRDGWMVEWHHQLDVHEFEQALGVGDGQGSLECRSPWGCKESDTTEWLSWTELSFSSGRELANVNLSFLLKEGQ